MDSSVSPTHGQQEMSVWNGHYARTCHHPLFVFNQFGDLDAVLCVPATCTALTVGTTCSSPSWRATRARSQASLFERTRPLRCPRSTFSGGGADQIRNPTTGQPGSAEQDRLSAQAPSRTTSAFQLSGWNLDQAAEDYRQGRVASRRTLSPRRLHRDEHEPPARARRCFLQQAQDVRATDQGGQRRDQVDATVVPNVRRQRGAAS